MKKKLLLLVTIFITGIILACSGEQDYLIHVFSIVLIAMAASITVRFDVLNPLCLYISMVTLYSVGYAILYSVDFSRNITRFGYNKETLFYFWFSISLMCLILPSKIVNFRTCKDRKSFLKNDIITQKLTTYISFFTYLGIIYIKIAGFDGKGDIYNNGGIGINLLAKIIYLNLFFYSYYLLGCFINGVSVDRRWLIFNFTSIALFGLITGERDYFFHVILSTFLIYFSVGKIKKNSLPIYGFLGILLVVLTKVFKYLFLRGLSDSRGNVDSQTLFFDFVDGEFSSAGRNLQVLVNQGYDNYFGGYSLIVDLIRVFYDFGVSTQTWFNDTVLYYVKTGYGFTLVGEGYVNGGIIGIIVVITMSTCLLRWFYLKSNNKFIFAVIYVYMLPQFIYATRADILNIISPFLKHVLPSILIIYICSKYLVKKKHTYRSYGIE